MLTACVSPSRTDLPNVGPFAPDHALPLGAASGDVTSDAVLIWTRSEGAARVQVEWTPDGEDIARGASRSQTLLTSGLRDYTAAILLEGLAPATSYRYTVLSGAVDHPGSGEPRATGRFRTAAAASQTEPVRFVWSADLGGQKRCREAEGGYAIFDRMRRVEPAFALLLGDLIYGDHLCPSPPNITGSDFVATSLDQFRAKHRYQRGDAALRQFLADVPVYATWDDHEVHNNFSGVSEPLMPVGRQALLEYWPIGVDSGDPYRFYRRVRRGADLELFILDTRQYRSPNEMRDGPGKTMLGVAQRDWLIAALAASTATWKVVATSVPLSIPKLSTEVPGNDSWARTADGTGFQVELRSILESVKSRGVRNLVWLAADVHFAQVNEYDPDGDGQVDFYEFVAGPLAALPGKSTLPEASFRPHTLYSEGGFMNFGIVEVKGKTLHLTIIDESGKTRFSHAITAQ